MKRLATYFTNNPLISDFCDWFDAETGITDYQVRSYTDGELYIESHGAELPIRQWLTYFRLLEPIRKPQMQMDI